MVIKDLKQVCAPCRGSGYQAGQAQWGIHHINPSGRCHVCAGRGFVLTELGQELVTLLRPFVLEMIEEAAPPRQAPATRQDTGPGRGEVTDNWSGEETP